MLDIDRLSRPISLEFPSGRDLRADAVSGLYFRLKDLRFGARAEERGIEPGQPFKLPAAWGDVRELAQSLLESETSDLEVLAWLAEAELRINGFAGLARGFALIGRLVEERFETLHSIDGESIDDRVAPIAGLNGVNGEGSLIQPIRLSPLVPGQAFFASSLWDFQLAQRPTEAGRRKELKDAAATAGLPAMRAHLAEVDACIAAFRDLTASLDARCGAHAPPSSAIRAVLEEARLAIINLGGAEMPASAAPSVSEDAPAAGAAAVSTRGPIGSREEALERLVEVADYFRRTEPQSPLSAAIDSAVARGRMDFPALLAELVQDEHVRRGILIAAGIRPPLGGAS